MSDAGLEPSVSAMPPSNPSDLSGQLDQLRRRADSGDLAERLAATDQLRGLLESHFEAAFEGTQSWVLDPSDRLREVACRALMIRDPEADIVQVRRLIGRAELFLGNPSRAVARVASAEVLPYLLGIHPRLMPDWIRTWLANPEELVRADLATVLAGLAPRFPAQAIDSLSALAVDPRPQVRAGFRSAVHAVARDNPKMGGYVRSRFANQF